MNTNVLSRTAGSGFWAGFPGFSEQCLNQDNIKVVVRVMILKRGSAFSWDLLGVNLLPCSYKTEVPAFLLAVSRLFSAPGTYILFHRELENLFY